MSEDKIVNDCVDIKIDIEEILNACARQIQNEEGKVDSTESCKVFFKYFNPQNSILDINKPLSGQGKWTALAFATYFGKTDEVVQLLRLGATPNIELDKKLNVLHMAATEGKEALCVFFLKNGVNIDSTCDRGMTALMKACEAGHLDVVKALMPFNPNIMLKDKDGKSCIEYCKESQSYDIIRYINNHYLNKTLPQKSEDEISIKKVSKI